MGNVHGRRKALLLFSEGIDYPMDDIFGAQNATDVIQATQDAITAAARGNVSIFGIDPRGLVGMSADAIVLDSPGASNDPAAAAANLAGFAAEMRLSQDSLQSLAEETGGFSSVNANDPAAVLRSHRQSQQHVLRARLLSAEPPARRAIPQDRGAREAAGLEGVRAKGLRGPARQQDAREESAAGTSATDAARLQEGRGRQHVRRLARVLNSPMQQGGVTMVAGRAVQEHRRK